MICQILEYSDNQLWLFLRSYQALGNPWILKDMVHYLETGEKLQPQTVREKVETAKHQLHALVKIHGEKRAVPEFRQQKNYY